MTDEGKNTVTVKFEEQDSHKVKASDTLYVVFYSNKRFKAVDFSGLDITNTTDLSNMFQLNHSLM